MDWQPMPETLESLLRMALAGPEAPTHPTAFVLPTTERVLDRVVAAASAGDLWVAGAEVAGAAAPAAILARLREGARPRVIVLFEDQLAGPAHATLLVRCAERDLHVSPAGFILADGYGYRLAVWGSERNRLLEGAESIEAVAGALVAHLDSCRRLGEDWSWRHAQSQREPAFRASAAMRKLRYLRSCVADVFAAQPDSAECGDFMARIAALEARIPRACAS
jgi:hypothetical protein